MLREQIVSFWGSRNLRRWPVASLREASLPDAAKSYLSDIGLPSRVDPAFRFGPVNDQLPRVKDRPDYLRIGAEGDVLICLDAAQGGRVMWLGGDVNLPGRHINPAVDRYINADVERFGECLLYFQQLRDTVRYSREDPQLEITEASTKEKIRRADPTAFADPDNLWAVTFEEIEAELS
jgi:hypothetical protein